MLANGYQDFQKHKYKKTLDFLGMDPSGQLQHMF